MVPTLQFVIRGAFYSVAGILVIKEKSDFMGHYIVITQSVRQTVYWQQNFSRFTYYIILFAFYGLTRTMPIIENITILQ